MANDLSARLDKAGAALADWMDGGAARPYAVLAVLCLALYLPGFFSIPPTDRDESRFAQASKQMIATGDYVDIRYQDTPRHKKPIGIYWLQAASVQLLNADAPEEIWAYRVPSLLGAVGAVLLTFWAGAALFGRRAAFLGAAILGACVVLGAEARIAKTDAVLLATIVAAQGALARLYLAGERKPETRAMAALFWTALGLGILVKGPIIVMVCGAAILFLVAVERRAGWLRGLRALPGVLWMLLLVAPWLIAITVATDGAFWTESVGTDLLGKVTRGQESHGAPPGSYLAAFWLTFWPFSFLAALAVPWLWLNRKRPEVLFCIAWIAPAWVIFEVVATKLPHYVLPTYPAIALLTAAAAMRLYGWAGPRLWNWRYWIPLGLWLLASLALPAAVAALPVVAGGEMRPGAALAGAVAIALAVFSLAGLRGRAQPGPVIALLAAALVVYATAYQSVFPSLDRVWNSPRLAAAAASYAPCPETALATAGYHEPSLVFLAGTETRLVTAKGAAAFLAQDECRIAIVESRQENKFRKALAEANVGVRELTRLEGYNLNGGDELVLVLYALDGKP